MPCACLGCFGGDMIISFSCAEAEKIWNCRVSQKFPKEIQDKTIRKMRQLDVANVIGDLRAPPGNYLQYTKSDRHGVMSIRINERWRLYFVWRDAKKYDVHIAQHHLD